MGGKRNSGDRSGTPVQAGKSGVVSFHKLGPEFGKIQKKIDFRGCPAFFVQTVGESPLNLCSPAVSRSLERLRPVKYRKRLWSLAVNSFRSGISGILTGLNSQIYCILPFPERLPERISNETSSN